GQVTMSGVNTQVACVQTNTGGTASAGSVLTAINVETGAAIWQTFDQYPTSGGASGRSSSHEAAPASGIPGGAVGLDTVGQGNIDKVVYGTLYGDVFVRAAATGVAQNGTNTPLFRMAVDYKPIGVAPAIYKESTTGNQFAAF